MNSDSRPIIWHIAAWWPTPDHPGDGLFIREHIRSISNQYRHFVIYLKIEKRSLGRPRVLLSEQSGELTELIVDIKTPLRRFGFDKFLIRHSYQRAFNHLQKQYGPPALTHVHVRSHISKFAIDVLIKNDQSFVLSEHFSFYHRGIYELDAKQQKAEKAAIRYCFTHRNIKAIMPVSKELADIFTSQYGVDTDRIKVIPNIADSCFKHATHIPQDEIRIALVAAWNFPKNPFIFFNGLSLLPQDLRDKIKVDIVGHGGQLDEMKAHVTRELPDWNITLHGYKKKPEFTQILQSADFFCHPTDQENLPTVIAEALCCGAPVLSMNVNGIPEMIDDSNGILIEPKSADAMKEGLLKMIQIRHEYNRKGIADAAHLVYDKGVIGKTIDEIYKGVFA